MRLHRETLEAVLTELARIKDSELIAIHVVCDLETWLEERLAETKGAGDDFEGWSVSGPTLIAALYTHNEDGEAHDVLQLTIDGSETSETLWTPAGLPLPATGLRVAVVEPAEVHFEREAAEPPEGDCTT